MSQKLNSAIAVIGIESGHRADIGTLSESAIPVSAAIIRGTGMLPGSAQLIAA